MRQQRIHFQFNAAAQNEGNSFGKMMPEVLLLKVVSCRETFAMDCKEY